jgi:hypothetical protein
LGLTALLIAIVSAAALLATAPGLPMAWDEGNAILRAEGIAHWAARWWTATAWAQAPTLPNHGGARPRPPAPWTRQAIDQDWAYTTRVEGHPALYGIVIALGRAVGDRWLSPLASARLGPILLFSLAVAALFYRTSRQWSVAAGVGAAAALLLEPRLFAHAHFASFDGPLTSCWLLAWAAFAPARDRRGAAVAWGILLGMTLSAKAPGWFAPLPFVAWAVLYRDRAAARALAIGIPVALATFFLLNPPLWHQPIDGLVTFFRLNLCRPPELNISTQFLGRMYNQDYSLPWYNTLFWTAVLVPVGLLALAMAGLVYAVRRSGREPAGMLIVFSWAVLLIVRALPGMPPHDAERLFLPSFAMLAALAGMGCHALVYAPSARRGLRAAVVLLYAGSATSLAWYAPQWLSYYNLLIGGLPGATAVGMEPTYYWDALDRPVLDWLHRHTGRDEKIRFGTAPSANLDLMRQWGTLRRDYHDDAPGRFAWYVVQRRPSGWEPCDEWLVKHGRPAFQKVIRHGGHGPWRLDVPLLDVYPYAQYLDACRNAEEKRAP